MKSIIKKSLIGLIVLTFFSFTASAAQFSFTAVTEDGCVWSVQGEIDMNPFGGYSVSCTITGPCGTYIIGGVAQPDPSNNGTLTWSSEVTPSSSTTQPLSSSNEILLLNKTINYLP